MNRILLFTAVAATLSAQPFLNNTEKNLRCDRDGYRGDRAVTYCEIREFPAAAAGRINVDGAKNGGAVIKGWDRSDMLVRAKVEAWAPTEGEGKASASQVHVQSAGGTIRSDAPDFGQGRGWAVSYEIFVPHRTGVEVKTHNGGVSIHDVEGEIRFEAVNGGVTLARLGGNVTGTTKNGGLKIELAGSRWQGGQLDVATTNGGVHVQVPDNYSAHLETSTVNGGMSVDYPVTLQGRIRPGRELSADLGAGGPLVRIKTVNGGVRIQRKS